MRRRNAKRFAPCAEGCTLTKTGTARGGAASSLNVLDQKLTNDLTHYSHPDWMGDYVAGEYIYGLVMNVTRLRARKSRFGDYKAALTEAQTKWAGGPPSRLLKRGDLAVFKVIKADNDKKMLEVILDQLPSVDGALICLESKTGDVKAMVGGYDFSTRKFNNATQAERQTGSTFKPFIYAAAIEEGFTPDTVVSAEPFTDPGTGWSPANYDGSSGGGMIPLRTALQQSLNVVAVRLLSIVGVDKGADIVKRFGLPNPDEARLAFGAWRDRRAVDGYGQRIFGFLKSGRARQTAFDQARDGRRRQRVAGLGA